MKKLNLYEIYEAGKDLSALRAIEDGHKVMDDFYDLWKARQVLQKLVKEDSPLLSTAKRAATNLLAKIKEVMPNPLLPEEEKKDAGTVIFDYRAHQIHAALSELESVLGNDMPEIASYIVSQKGIYRTDDLIAHPENHLAASIRKTLPHQACFDLQQAGKCLAYELATACTFHLWRAVETVMFDYYHHLAGSKLEDDSGSRNWGAYIKTLQAKYAEEKITAFLDHIRKEYRNPQTHPDAEIEIEDAQRLFSVAISSIDQMLREADRLRKNKLAATLSQVSVTTPNLLLSGLAALSADGPQA